MPVAAPPVAANDAFVREEFDQRAAGSTSARPSGEPFCMPSAGKVTTTTPRAPQVAGTTPDEHVSVSYEAPPLPL